MTTCVRLLVAAVLGGLALAGLEPPARAEDRKSITDQLKTAPKPAPAVPTAPRPTKEQTLLTYYLHMHHYALRSRNWLVRSMAVVGLSRIDDAKVTEKLLEVLGGGKTALSAEELAKAREQRAKEAKAMAAVGFVIPRDEASGKTDLPGDNLVRAFAWQALAGRYGSMTSPQRKQWRQWAVDLCRSNSLPGDLRLDLVRLLEAEGATEENLQLFSLLFAHTNCLDPYDMRTLQAMRELVARWKHPELIKALIAAMGDLNKAYRAEYLLGDLKANVPTSASLVKKGSKVLWREVQSAWVEWFKQSGPKDAPAIKPGPFRSHGLLPRPEKITNADDPKWRRDLEIEKFRLDPIDVAFVVDATGSMTAVVNWVKSDVLKMMRAFSLISLEPRIGVTFYRDHGDEYVTKVFELTGDAHSLTRAIQFARAGGGADIPEAVFDGLRDTFDKMGWSRGQSIRRIVILVGDAPPHENTLDDIEKMVKAAAKLGTNVYCIKVKTPKTGDVGCFDQIARWGKGKSMWGDFSKAPQPNSTDLAEPVDLNSPDHQIFCEVLKGITPTGYHDRIEPFVTVLSQYVQTPSAENREHFDDEKTIKARQAAARARRGRGGGGGRPNPRAQ